MPMRHCKSSVLQSAKEDGEVGWKNDRDYLLLEPWAVQAALDSPTWWTRSQRKKRRTRSGAAHAILTNCAGREEGKNEWRRSTSQGRIPQSPAEGRFRKGQSGNPAGRPKGRHYSLPYEAVLGQLVTIREDGVERRVTAAEAFLLLIMKRGLEGDGPSARAAMEAIEQAKASGLVRKEVERLEIRKVVVAPGSVSGALELLRMAKKMDPFRETATIMLEPWLVEMALARLGDRRLIGGAAKGGGWCHTDPVESALAGLVGKFTALRRQLATPPRRLCWVDISAGCGGALLTPLACRPDP